MLSCHASCRPLLRQPCRVACLNGQCAVGSVRLARLARLFAPAMSHCVGFTCAHLNWHSNYSYRIRSSPTSPLHPPTFHLPQSSFRYPPPRHSLAEPRIRPWNPTLYYKWHSVFSFKPTHLLSLPPPPPPPPLAPLASRVSCLPELSLRAALVSPFRGFAGIFHISPFLSANCLTR